jgi:hypothetical protein
MIKRNAKSKELKISINQTKQNAQENGRLSENKDNEEKKLTQVCILSIFRSIVINKKKKHTA